MQSNPEWAESRHGQILCDETQRSQAMNHWRGMSEIFEGMLRVSATHDNTGPRIVSAAPIPGAEPSLDMSDVRTCFLSSPGSVCWPTLSPDPYCIRYGCYWMLDRSMHAWKAAVSYRHTNLMDNSKRIYKPHLLFPLSVFLSSYWLPAIHTAPRSSTLLVSNFDCSLVSES